MPRIQFTTMVIGNTYKTTALLTSITQKTTKMGKNYLELGLSDGECKIIGKMWDADKDHFVLQVNSLVDVTLSAKDYQGSADYSINEISRCIDPYMKVEDFILKIPYDPAVLYDNIIRTIQSSPDPRFTHPAPGEKTIADLTIAILEQNKKDYIAWAAAKSVHHAIYGGLVYHSFRMCMSAFMLCKVYRMADREMLVCGAALHDIGKLIELNSVLGVANYTSAGRKLGHAYIGMRMIEKEAEKATYNQERIDNLLHLIASHHGLGEYGAIAYPATLEADLLHQIDVIDAHAYEYETELVNTEPGECSEKRIFGLDGNTIYRPECLTDEIIDGVNNPNLWAPKK